MNAFLSAPLGVAKGLRSGERVLPAKMYKILISSRGFFPEIGGAETNAEILARQFVKQGHQVTVVTEAEGDNLDRDARPFPFRVVRRPTPTRLLTLVRDADVYLHNGVSLRHAWPLLVVRRPWVVRHLTWLSHGVEAPQARLALAVKKRVLRAATSISISNAVASHLDVPSTVIPNPYRDDLFQRISSVPRDRDIVFVGRLVSDKGVDLVVQALHGLRREGLKPTFTIVGEGPEREPIRRLVEAKGLDDQVHLVGAKTGRELVGLLNQHDVIVVPSRWDEPFGVVALEGIACGCVAVASEGGGLRDAVGPCGLCFPNGDVEQLMEALRRVLSEPELRARCRAAAPSHLESHRQAEVARAYLKVIEKAVEGFAQQGTTGRHG